MGNTRAAAVAGMFYPQNRYELAASVRQYLAAAGGTDHAPKAIIAPHAGYIYSGPTAGQAYAALKPAAGTITRVVLLGPAHRVGFAGIAAPSSERFETPLGSIAIDRAAIDSIADLPQVVLRDDAHRDEHSLEVHLPFLQEVLGTFTLVPLVVGQCDGRDVAEVLDRLWGGPETLIVISSDLSHYHDYETARRLDAATTRAIEHLDVDKLGAGSACGRVPLRGLLLAARRHGLEATAIDVRNSGDTAGPREEVVGYGAYVFL